MAAGARRRRQRRPVPVRPGLRRSLRRTVTQRLPREVELLDQPVNGAGGWGLRQRAEAGGGDLRLAPTLQPPDAPPPPLPPLFCWEARPFAVAFALFTHPGGAG